MRIAIRVDASLEIGSGHVMRCLTLAETLRDNGAEVMFICRPHVGNLNALIEARGFELAQLAAPNLKEAGTERPQYADWLGARQSHDAMETVRAISRGGGHADWVIVDHYAIESEWERTMRACANHIMVIDDLADRQHDCDLLLDQNLVAKLNERYQALVPAKSKILLGPRFALLQSNYASLHAQSTVRKGTIKRAIIYFGGADTQNLTALAIKAFSLEELRGIHLDVVSSAKNSNLAMIKALCSTHGKATLHIDLPSLAPVMQNADLAVGATGATSWERICLGLPALVVTLAENQQSIAQELHRLGAVVLLGDAHIVTQETLSTALQKQLRVEQSSVGLEEAFAQIDGKGALRVACALTSLMHEYSGLQLRNATVDDERLLFDWANDPETRSRSIATQLIEPAQHHIWFSRRIDNPDCKILIAENAAASPVGYVRFEKDGAHWLISYAIGKAYRGVGLGRPMLEAGIDDLRIKIPTVSLKALVQYDNSASRRIFEKLNFEKHPESGDTCIYSKSYETSREQPIK